MWGEQSARNAVSIDNLHTRYTTALPIHQHEAERTIIAEIVVDQVVNIVADYVVAIVDYFCIAISFWVWREAGIDADAVAIESCHHLAGRTSLAISIVVRGSIIWTHTYSVSLG